MSVVGLVMLLMVASPVAVAGSVKVSSSVASVGVSGAGTDGFENCAPNGQYATHRSESEVAADPLTPGHLVGVSKFFFSSMYQGALTDWAQVYRFQLGSYESFNGGASYANELLPGYDCVTGPANGLPGWDAATDPILAFAYNSATGKEDVFAANLGFNYNNFANAIEVSKKPAGGDWQIPVVVDEFTGMNGGGRVYDKQWIAADYNPPCSSGQVTNCSPFSGNVYVAWTIFGLNTGKIYFSRSTDGGATFSPPSQASQFNGPYNTFVYMDVDTRGTLYMEYASFATKFAGSGMAFVQLSTDGGKSFSKPFQGPNFNGIPFGVSVAPNNPTNGGTTLPSTTFRDGIIDFFAVSHTHPGYLYIAAEQWNAQDGTGTPSLGNGDYDVAVYRSTNGGQTWQSSGFANDANTVGDATDQFQPSVATDSSGHMAVAFFDRRNPCPAKQPAPNYFTKPSASNYCIQTSLQWYDDGTGQRVGGNLLLGPSWDPQEPSNGPAPIVPQGSPVPSSYVSDLPHSVFDACYNSVFGFYVPVCVTFIGDYFGLTVSGGTAYIINISTYPTFQYPSGVTAWSQAATSGTGPSSIKPAANNYYQQQISFITPAPF